MGGVCGFKLALIKIKKNQTGFEFCDSEFVVCCSSHVPPDVIIRRESRP